MRLFAVAAAAALAVTLAALKFFPAPFVWITAAWTVTGIIGAATLRSTAPRLINVVAAAASFTLGAAEAWLWIAPSPSAPTIERSPDLMVRDSGLGWRLAPARHTPTVARWRDTVLYDVTYGTDAAGRRRGYPATAAASQGCVWFFVCSFSFGEGVADTATLPYRVGARTGGRYRTVNFGAPGYGAEHMLAVLQDAGATPAPPCRPTHVIYQALPDHVRRVGGHTEFSRLGPHYELGSGDAPVRHGLRRPTAPPSRLMTQLRKSRLYTRLASRAARPASRDDLRLYAAVVRASRNLLAERFPEARVHFLVWSLHAELAGDFAAFRDSLRAIEPQSRDVRDILPDYDAAPRRYQIHARDAHPNALAHDLLARFVAESLLGVPQP